MLTNILKHFLDIFCVGGLCEVAEYPLVLGVRVHRQKQLHNELLCCLRVGLWSYRQVEEATIAFKDAWMDRWTDSNRPW